jgi:WD40 repeat protein
MNRFHRVIPVAILSTLLTALASGQSPPNRSAEIVARFHGNTDTVETIALSPDGSQAATACFDHYVRLYDAASGKEIRTYGGQQGHTGQVLSVAFSVSGDQLASGGSDNSARIWDVPVAFPNKTFGLSSAAARVAVASDGKTFGVAGADGVVRVFPAGDDKGAFELKGHNGPVTLLAAGGPSWVSAGADKTIRVWAADGKLAGSYSLGTTDITGLAIGQSVYTVSSDALLRAWQNPPQPTRSFPSLKEPVTAFYASADGNTLLFATADQTITLGTFANNSVAGTFAGAKTPVQFAALSPDAATVLAGCSNGSLLLWDKQSKLKADFAPHGKEVVAAAFHPTQPLLITAGGDGAVKAWTLPIDPKQSQEKAVKFELKAHKGKATGLAIHPATGQLITSGADKFIRVWDPAKPEKALKEIGPLANPVSQLTISRDGQLLAGVAGKDVYLWNTTDGKEAGKLAQTADVLSLSFSPDKTRLLIGRADNLAALVEVASGAVVQTYAHSGPVRGALIHPGNQHVVTASADKSFAISPIAVQRMTPLGGKVKSLSISPGLDRLVTAGPGNECVTWLANNGQKERAFPTGGEALAAAFSKDGQRLAVSGADGSVKLYTVGDGKLLGSLAATGPVTELAFHPTLPQLVGIIKNLAVAWNVAVQPGQAVPADFGKVLQTFSQPQGAGSLAFNAEGQFFMSGGDKTVRRFKIAADAPVKNFQHPNLVDCLAFDGAGALLATGCHDGVLRIWDIAKNTPLKTINAHVVTMPQPVQNPIYAVVWTHDYKQIFTASYDRSIKLWDVATGNLVREFKPAPDPKPIEKKDDKKEEKKDDKKGDKKDEKKGEKKEEKKEPPKAETGGLPGHRDAVFALALAKDGKLLASGSSDGSLKLWDVASGKVIRDFPNPDLKPVFPEEPAPSHPGWIHGVRFTPDGQQLVSAGAAPRLKSYLAVWTVADGKRIVGAERDYGPIHSLDITKDGSKLLIGCAAVRGRSEAEALLIRFPGR